MTLCSDKHGEVCYDDIYCPVCVARAKILNLEAMIETMKAERRKKAGLIGSVYEKARS